MNSNENINRQTVEEIRKHREKRGYSREYIAQILGICPGAYASKESGTRSFYIKEISKLADFYGISCQELITGIKPKMLTPADIGLNQETVQSLKHFREKNPPEAMAALSICLSSMNVLKLLATYFSFPHTEEYRPPKFIRKTDDGMYEYEMTPAALERIIELALIKELDNVRNSK